jgi:predicted Rdx family selenoprotein
MRIVAFCGRPQLTGAGLPYSDKWAADCQRAAILASPLSELTGFNLSVDCLTPGCGGERTFAIARSRRLLWERADGGRRAASDAVFRRL